MTLNDAMAETKIVIFDAVDNLLKKTGIIPSEARTPADLHVRISFPLNRHEGSTCFEYFLSIPPREEPCIGTHKPCLFRFSLANAEKLTLCWDSDWDGDHGLQLLCPNALHGIHAGQPLKAAPQCAHLQPGGHGLLCFSHMRRHGQASAQGN